MADTWIPIESQKFYAFGAEEDKISPGTWSEKDYGSEVQAGRLYVFPTKAEAENGYVKHYGHEPPS